MNKNSWLRIGAAGTVALSALLSTAGSAFAIDDPPASARPADDIAAARGLSRAFQHVAKQAEPAVVNIVSFRKQPIYERVNFFEARPTGKTRMMQLGLGSGVVVSRDGLILTNNHVVADADRLDVKFRDGTELEAKLVGRDPLTDLAVIRVDAKDLPAAEFADSEQLDVGEWVVAIGSPFGFANTVTAGIVSAKGRSGIALPGQDDNAYQDFIQTDAAINPGNSGGPLLNLDGKIVGINSAIASRAGGSEGIGFAIPSNMARSVMEGLVKNGRVVRGYLGVQMNDIRMAQASSLGVKPGQGVLVENVLEASPGDKAGLKDGDVIVRYNGKAVSQRASLRTAIALTPPGTQTKVEVLRDGKTIDLPVTVGDESAAIDSNFVSDLGLVVRPFTREDARGKRYLRDVEEGCVVVSAEDSGRAARAGIQPGDIIVKIDSATTPDAQAFNKAVHDGDLDRGLVLSVIRDRQKGRIVIGR